MSKREFLETLLIELNKNLVGYNIEVIFSDGLQEEILSISKSDISIAIPTEMLFKAYCNGITIRQIVRKIKQIVTHSSGESMNKILHEIVNCFDWAAPYLYAMVECGNNDNLVNVPYRNCLDLAVTYYVEIPVPSDGVVRMKVTDKLFEKWNIAAETLHNTAMTNTFTKKNQIIAPVADVISEISNRVVDERLAQDGNRLLILTNESTMLGAINIFNIELLDNAAFLLSTDDIYIIPSSIHEILICDTIGIDAIVLKETIREVNQSMVLDNEFLSNNLYMFSRKTKSISIV